MAEGLGRPVKTIKTDRPANAVLLKAASDPMIEAGTLDASLHAIAKACFAQARRTLSAEVVS